MDKFKKITVCVDLYGCPNRCKHCWLGHTPNGHLSEEVFAQIALMFKPYAHYFECVSWYREPDFKDNYIALWDLEHKISTEHHTHYDLASFYRLARDESYAEWLSNLGVKTIQFTLFGGEKTTDYFVGRTGAYREMKVAIERVLKHKIAPRIQIIVNKENILELNHVVRLVQELELEKRCEAIGQEFSLFIHQGSCEGENTQFYKDWLTKDDLNKIPEYIVKKTIKHFNQPSIEHCFGHTEETLYKHMINNQEIKSMVVDDVVFYIDKDLFVYPNVGVNKWWSLGNIKKEGVKKILENYRSNRSIAQMIMTTVSVSEIVRKIGDVKSQRLFHEEDYYMYCLNQYCILLGGEYERNNVSPT